MFQDHAAVRLVRIAARARQQAAQDRSDLSHSRPSSVPVDRGGAARGAAAQTRSQETLRAIDVLDHPLVTRAGVGREGEEPVLEEHHPVRVRLALEHLGGQLRQPEPGHHVWHHHHSIAEGLADQPGAIRLVGERQDRIRVGVVDEGVRQEGVQQRLHRRVGGGGVEEVRAQLVHHLLVGERLQFPQPSQPAQVDRGEPLRLDGVEVPAAALDAERLEAIAEQVLLRHLHGGVPAAVHDQVGFCADQPRRVDAQRKRIAAARRIPVAELSGLAVGPAALHGAKSRPDRCAVGGPSPGWSPAPVAHGASRIKTVRPALARLVSDRRDVHQWR